VAVACGRRTEGGRGSWVYWTLCWGAAAAEEAVSRLSPDERTELVEHLRQQARQQDVNFPGLHETPNLEQPGMLASLMSSMHGQQPGILRQLLGGNSGGGSGAQSNVAKAALAGIAAIGLKKALGGRGLF